MSVVFGVDVVKGSVHGKIKPRYAVAILEQGNVIEKVVSRAKLFRMIRELKPEIVAVDNIYEVFKSKEDMIVFLKDIPAKTKLVQVSGQAGSLPSLSKRFGLKINIRNPMDEAKACAYLASFGVGSEISVFMDKTKITVSRNRSLGKGGWRQKKYGRRVHDSVRMIYREIKRKLDELGFDYIEEIKKGYGGISKGILLVSASKTEIPLNSFRTRDVQVKVEAIEKDRVEYIPLSKTRRYTIIGIDPGTTTAVAAIDLNGNLIDVKSKKGWSPGDVLEFISGMGNPVVVATDKNNPPEYVLKIKAAFNAVLYTPKEDMSIEKKKNLTNRYKILNDHERDALAAAIDAFNSFKNKLRNVEKRIPAGLDTDKVKAEIIKGTPLKDFLKEKVEKEEEKEKRVQQEEISREEIERRDRIIKELEEENRVLKKEIGELREEIERLRAKIVAISKEEHERVRRDNYVKTLEHEIRDLKRQLKARDETICELEEKIELIKKMKFLEFTGWKSVKVLRKFTKDEIERVEKSFGFEEGDIVYIMDSSGGGKVSAEMLCRRKIKAVIYENEMSHLASEVFDEYGIPRIHSGEVEILSGEEMAVVNTRVFNEVYERKLKDIKERRLDKLEKIIEDYRYGRFA
jgi:hypothetical protein